jgi:hypothetical protein
MLYQDNVLSLVFFHVIKLENSKFELFFKVTILDQNFKPEKISSEEVTSTKVS